MTFRISGGVGLVVLGFFIYSNFIDNGIRSPVSSPVVQPIHAIGLAMYSYAQDHNGALPVGKSSTEVFQQLVDGGYITDTTIFYIEKLKVPGKFKATSSVLKSENICFDVTIPVDANSPDSLPIIFSTGYKVSYIPTGAAVPLFSAVPSLVWWNDRPSGIAVYYHGNSAIWLNGDEKLNGKVIEFTPADFDPKGKKYVQLTPTGPLSP